MAQHEPTPTVENGGGSPQKRGVGRKRVEGEGEGVKGEGGRGKGGGGEQG